MKCEKYGPISTSDSKLANAVTNWGRGAKEHSVCDLSECQSVKVRLHELSPKLHKDWPTLIPMLNPNKSA